VGSVEESLISDSEEAEDEDLGRAFAFEDDLWVEISWRPSSFPSKTWNVILNHILVVHFPRSPFPFPGLPLQKNNSFNIIGRDLVDFTVAVFVLSLV
jgi:hypothetical protein